MPSSRFFRSLGLLLTAVLMFGGCSPQDKDLKPLRIGMNTWPGYEPFVLGKEKGFLSENVGISRVDSATDVIKAIRSNIIDVACITLDEAIILKERSEEPIKIIAIIDFSTGGDVIIAKKEIASMPMLKGKKVGVESSALGSFMITRAVDLTPELELNDLKIVNLGYEHHEKEYTEGRIDAVVTFEPVKTRLLQGNAHVIFDSRQIPGEIIDVMVVKDQTIAAKAEAIQAMIDGWFKSVEFIGSEREKSLAMMAGYEEIGVDEFSIAYRGLSIPSRSENQAFFSANLGSSIAKMQQFLHDKGLIHQTFEEEQLFTDEFLKR